LKLDALFFVCGLPHNCKKAQVPVGMSWTQITTAFTLLKLKAPIKQSHKQLLPPTPHAEEHCHSKVFQWTCVLVTHLRILWCSILRIVILKE